MLRGIFTCFAAFALMLAPLKAQQKEQSDSLVRLISAKSMEQVDRNGQSYRKVIGPARFLHNNTYLLCDTAFWNMNTSIIECIDNVSIIQEDTKLTSDKLTYLVDEDLAQFRGSLVQLEDKDGNTLRTRHLDYNTKDSVAIFSFGGAMRDVDGQIIESKDGRYDSKIKMFAFKNNVNMFTDSIFIKTTSLDYYSQTGMAYFGRGTDAWKEENMLSADDGWYDRPRELFLFRKNVHGMNNTQEAWGDSLYFNRNTREVELLGNAQITDTTRNSYSMGGRMLYVDSLSRLTMTRDPVVIGVVKGEKPDTAYARADIFVYYTRYKCDISQGELAASDKRLKDIETDAVGEYRKKVAEEAAKAAEEALKNDPNAAPNKKLGLKGDKPSEGPPAPAPADILARPDTLAPAPAVTPPADSLATAAPADSLATAAPADSLAPSPALVPTDSLSVKPDSLTAKVDSLALLPRDSTKISYLTGRGNFRLFKSDLQIVSDSLEYNAIDSLIRLYKRPLIWNDIRRQYSSDSLFARVRNGSMEKASLMSDAFVIVKEDTLCFDQIRSTEMMAYFDTAGTITRFDALGDADAVFYIQEDSTYATVNLSKSKILTAIFKDGDVDQVFYYDQAKSDAYPVAQIKQENRTLKGFAWEPDKRPRSKEDITDRTLRPSQRRQYAAHPKATFVNTDKYFPGYMQDVYEGIAEAKRQRELRRLMRQQEEARRADSIALAKADSLTNAKADSLATEKSDSLTTSKADSLVTEKADSLKPSSALDTTAAPKPLTPAELKALEKEKRRQEKEAAAREKAARKEREWARLDSLDAVKAAAKAAAKAEKERNRKRKIIEKRRQDKAREDALLQKYIEYYRRKKEAEDRKKQATGASKAE